MVLRLLLLKGGEGEETSFDGGCLDVFTSVQHLPFCSTFPPEAEECPKEDLGTQPCCALTPAEGQGLHSFFHILCP